MMHHGDILTSVGDIHVIDCEVCGFAHVNPLPSSETISAFYQEQFYQVEKTNYFESTQKDKAWHHWHYARRLALIEKHLQLNKLAPSLIDIGSGPGSFLKFLQDKAWRALGIEPAPPAVAWTQEQGCEAVASFFTWSIVEQFKGEFSVVHLANVLEHVVDPKEVLDQCYELLPDSGLLFVQVPNDYNRLQGCAIQTKQEPWWVSPDHHINYFNFSSLLTLASRCGFAELERSTTFPMELFLLMGKRYTSDPDIGRECHEMRMALELAFDENLADHPRWIDEFYAWLASQGQGREVVLLLQKVTRK